LFDLYFLPAFLLVSAEAYSCIFGAPFDWLLAGGGALL
jgi:hypothetical protein